ncbi:hypothetical protein IAD21_03135 [Abditibacteriota bacterium]|nr:hypothetical protein IAD21_03135 [Abditibacteriota bacterium]
MTLFNWFDEVEEFDAPFSRSWRNPRCTDSSPWYWRRISDGLVGAFDPQTIAAWCEVAKSFSWDECEPFFEQAKKDSWLSFKGFRAYGQSWLDHYEEARQQDAGLLICHY